MTVVALVYGDINRVIHGYDNCGNICGMRNKMIDNIDCSGQDHSGKK